MSHRSFYSSDIKSFVEEPAASILSSLVTKNPYELNTLQRDAWMIEIEILKQQLQCYGYGRIILEYTIPRMGKRVDAVVLIQGIIFLLEFKVGDTVIQKHAIDQVMDYALDLKNFQKESHSRVIVPIVVSTEAEKQSISIHQYQDGILYPLGANREQIVEIINISNFAYREPWTYSSTWVIRCKPKKQNFSDQFSK